jgi:HK97 gp10 family phage protein
MVVAVIGPKKDAKSTKKIGRGRKAKTVQRVPVRYAHLVEFGTVRTRAKPFLGPAYARAKTEAPQVFAKVAWTKIAAMAAAAK